MSPNAKDSEDPRDHVERRAAYHNAGHRQAVAFRVSAGRYDRAAHDQPMQQHTDERRDQ